MTGMHRAGWPRRLRRLRRMLSAWAAVTLPAAAAFGPGTAAASADPVTITTLTGSTIMVPGDKPTAMFFFAISCPSCIGAMKSVGQAAEKTGDTAVFVLVDMNSTDSPEDVADLQGATGTDKLPAVIDTDASLTVQYSVTAPGTLLVIDPSGEISYRGTDPSADQITAALPQAAAG